MRVNKRTSARDTETHLEKVIRSRVHGHILYRVYRETGEQRGTPKTPTLYSLDLEKVRG